MLPRIYSAAIVAAFALLAHAASAFGNSAPVGDTGLVISGKIGEPLISQRVTATDADGDRLTYSLANNTTLPSGLTLNADGTVTGTCNTYENNSFFFQASDGTDTSTPTFVIVNIYDGDAVVVNTTSDVTDDLDGVTSLREAVNYANSQFALVEITFDPTVFATPKTIALSSRIDLRQKITITGPAAGVTIDGANSVPLFRINQKAANFSKITFSGGASLNNFRGGGALNVGAFTTVTATDCTFTRCGLNNSSASGGAVYNAGSLTLTNCTFAGNAVKATGASGAAIYMEFGDLTLRNCTITGNTAQTGGTGTGGGIFNDAGALKLGNTIVSGNTADSQPDITGAFDSLGFNLIGNTTGATFTAQATDLTGANAQLDPAVLGFNGGPVPTVALLPGSAALDAGKRLGGVTTDARGLATFDNSSIANATGGDGSDIGAYEAQAPAPEIAVEVADTNLDLRSGDTTSLGDVEVGAKPQTVFRLRNKGVATLNLTGNPIVAISGANAAEFSVVAQLPAQLTGQSSLLFTVVCTPSSTGARSALLTIASNDADEATFTIGLTAQGVDTITVPATIVSPVEGGLLYPLAQVTYVLPEQALQGTVTFNFINATDQYQFNISESSGETPGSHTVTFDTAAAGMPLGDYSLSLLYSDAAGHLSALTGVSLVTIRPPDPITAKSIAAGETAPGAGTFPGLPADAQIDSFNPPAIDDDGNVAYVAKWSSKTGGASSKPTKGTGLFRNGACLALVGGDASALFGTSATWKSFTDPVVSGGGVACIATLSGVKTGTSAVIADLGTGLEAIARAGDPAPGATVGGATFKSFKAVSVQSQSPPRVAFLAQLTAGTGTPKVTAANDIGLWYFEPPTNLLFVMRENDPAGTKTIKTLVSFLPGNGSPGNGRGTYYNVPGGDPILSALALFTDKTQGIVSQNVDDGLPSVILSLSSDAATGLDTGGTFASYGNPAFSSAGNLVFPATLTLDKAKSITKANAGGIFTGPNVNGTFTSVVRIGGDASESGAGAVFKQLKDPVISSDGAIAFPATTTAKGAAGNTLWWKKPGQARQLLAQVGGADAPDLPGAKFKSFTSLAIAGGNRGPIFIATLAPNKTNVTAATATGVWACDFTGNPRLLFRTGDKVDVGGTMKTVKSFTLLKATVGNTGVTRSFNDAAQVVWLATFDDKKTAIVTSEVP